MAKVTINYDTVAKECEILMDGKAMENVMSCDMYYNYDKTEDGKPKFSMAINTMIEDKDNKMVKYETVRASIKQPEKPSVAQAIAKYLFDSK